MKILLLGDYSNYHACLGVALTRAGHTVTVASDGGGWMNTARSLSLSRPLPGIAGGAALFAKLMFSGRLKGYDIVSIINPSFVRLKPSRLKPLFNRLKRQNGRVFMGSVGTDKAVMDFLKSPDCTLRYNEYFSAPGVPFGPNSSVLTEDSLWQAGAIGDFCEYVYDNVDGVTTALYEYHQAMSRRFPADMLRYAGIPIDPADIQPDIQPGFKPGSRVDEKPNIFLGRHRHRAKFKGTDRLEVAARRVAEEFPDKCSLTIVENIPYDEYCRKLNSADVVLDQIYSYSPATNALLAMAKGKAVVSGGEPEYYDFIGETRLRPIINAVPDDEELYRTIRRLVVNPALIAEAASHGPEFVARHNSADLVARRHLDFWQSKM